MNDRRSGGKKESMETGRGPRAPSPTNGPTLSCETVERRIGATARAAASVADALEFDRSVLLHVRTCDACRRELESLRDLRAGRLGRALAAIDRDAPSDDPFFVGAVLSRVRDEEPPVRRRERLLRGRWIAAAAAVLIAAIVGFGQLPGPPSPGRPVAANAGSSPLGLTDGVSGLPDEFILGHTDGYLPCDWIPSAEVAPGSSSEVRF